LSKLSEIRGISGHEGDVRSFIINEIKGHCDDIWTDSIGNLYARTNKNGKSNIGLFAHMDEVGFMVTGIDGGLLTFSAVGGINPDLLPGTRVLVGNDPVPGVIGCPPMHLQNKEERKRKIPIDNMRIDVGDVSDAIEIGDPVTFYTKYIEKRGLCQGKAFDDRIGCDNLISLITSGPDVDCTYVFTVQEEAGLRGSKVAGNNLDIDYAIVCEGTFSLDQPGLPREDRMPVMGKGPVITIADRSVITDAKLRQAIVDAAGCNDIPYQYKRPFAGGTDAGMLHLSGRGVPSCVISTSCRYIHSPCSMAKIVDIENTRKLISESLLKISEGL